MAVTIPSQEARVQLSDFPRGWRYLPLTWSASDSKFIPAIAYKSNPKYAGFRGEPPSEDIVKWANLPGKAVGVMPEHCEPPLVVIDCDSVAKWVQARDGSQELDVCYGIDQLSALYARQRQTLDDIPAAKSQSLRHGHLYYSQNPRFFIPTSRYKPGCLALDVKTTGYVVHWSAPGRSLVTGRIRLQWAPPPELPAWLAAHFLSQRGTATYSGHRIVQDAALSALIKRTVTSAGPLWNQRIFNAACNMAECGEPYREILHSLLEAAEPWNGTEYRKAARTIASAWHHITGESKDIREAAA